MKQLITVLNSNQLNRDNSVFTIGCLENALSEKALTGTPSFIGHDMHRPVGWIFPIGLYMEPSLVRLIGKYLISESEKDQISIFNAHQEEFQKRIKKETSPFITEFNKQIEGYLSDRAKLHFNGCIIYHDTDLLYNVFPDLHSDLDKNKLVYLDNLLVNFEYLGQGIFKDKHSEFTIFANQYFRRNLSYLNNFHNYFLDQFIAFSSNPNIKLRISLDNDIIGYAKSFRKQIEMEYWWGPKYSDDINNIPNGVTHYKSDNNQKYFSLVSGTEFWWKKHLEGNNCKHELEIEELRDEPTIGVDSENYGCRYIHSIYDANKEIFEHFDGGIRMYKEMEMLDRLGKKINKAGKNTEYTKLFRIDGKLNLADWKSLITNYFQDNPLLFEYFGLREEYNQLQNDTNLSKSQGITKLYLPYSIKKKHGLRLFLSYHKPTDYIFDSERLLINPDTYSINGVVHNVVEFDTIELKKALLRLNATITFPENLRYINIKDSYINFPTIFHSKENMENNIKTTFQALSLIITALNKKYERTISFSIAWLLKDKEVRLAVMGNSDNILKWLKTIDKVPIAETELTAWIEKQNIWLTKNYDQDTETPNLYSIIKPDGVLYMKRKFIDSSWIDITTENEIQYTLNIPNKPENKEIQEAVSNELINPAFSFFVDTVKCSKSKENYFDSITSKLLDEDVCAVIETSSFAGFHWTDK